MKTLVRSVGRTDIGGEPLPAVFKAFESNKIIFRRAEVSMMAGTPGVGKSTLALALALKMKVPTLYISADTNAHTMAMRLASMISGKNQTDVEYLLQNDLGWTKATLAKGSHIVWSFESSPSLVDIDEEVQAFEELWGCPPVAIFVDNLMGGCGRQTLPTKVGTPRKGGSTPCAYLYSRSRRNCYGSCASQKQVWSSGC